MFFFPCINFPNRTELFIKSGCCCLFFCGYFLSYLSITFVRLSTFTAAVSTSFSLFNSFFFPLLLFLSLLLCLSTRLIFMLSSFTRLKFFQTPTGLSSILNNRLLSDSPTYQTSLCFWCKNSYRRCLSVFLSFRKEKRPFSPYPFPPNTILFFFSKLKVTLEIKGRTLLGVGWGRFFSGVRGKYDCIQ